MSKFKFVLDRGGVRELLKSTEIADICEQYASNIKAAAGEGYKCELRHYPERTGAAVYPETDKAYFENLHKNTLLKAMHK